MQKLTIILAMLIASMTFAQEEEVVKELPPNISSKHLVSFNGVFSYPLLYSRLNNTNSAFKHNLNWGGRLSYIYSPSKRFGFGLEYGVDISKVNLLRGRGSTFYSLITTDHLSIRHEGMRLLTQNIMPKIEWKRGHSGRPGGIVHQFGIGIIVSKVLKRNYDYTLNYFDQSFLETASWVHSNDAEENFKEEQLYNYKNKPFIGGAIMYRIAYRGRLTESLLWSVGLRNQLNYNPAISSFHSEFDEEDRNYWITRREMESIVAINRFESLFQLDLGISYHF